jgi:hypothetical protein
MSGFIDFAEVKARCSIEQAAKLLGFQTTLPTGELTGYIGVTKAKLPKEFHLSNVVTFPRRPLRQYRRENARLFFNA